MKKTLTINLWSQVFHIDEDAYEVLQDYLLGIEKKFTDRLEGKEVMGDVESRIAELFRERLQTSRQVVNMEDVNEVIQIIGSPEDFEETSEQEENKNTGKKAKSGTRRLYRNADDRILGGVGGGLAAYFGIDPTVARLLLILTFFISGPLIYIILWLIVPEAQTTAQKLEMNGDPINLSNIEKKIKDEFGKVSETIKSDKAKQKFREASKNTWDVLSGFLNVIFRSFMVLLGISFLILGSVMLIALVLGLILPSSNGLDSIQFLEIFFEKDIVIISIIGLVLLLGVPIISLIILGIRMIFGIKYSFNILKKTMIAFFICGIILTGYVAIKQVLNNQYKCQLQDEIKLDSLQGKTLVLTSEQLTDTIYENSDFIFDSQKWAVQDANDNSLLQIRPRVSIYKSEKQNSELKVNKICRNKSKKEGLILLKKLPTLVNVSDSIISITPYLHILSGSAFHFQEERISLYLSVGTKIYFPKNRAFNLEVVDSDLELSYSELFGKTMVMTEKGLVFMAE